MDYAPSNDVYTPSQAFPVSTHQDTPNPGRSTVGLQPPATPTSAWNNFSFPSNPQPFSDSLNEIQQIPISLPRAESWNPFNLAGQSVGNAYPTDSQPPLKRKRTLQGYTTMSEIGAQMNHCHFSDSTYGRSLATKSVPGGYPADYFPNTMQPAGNAVTPSAYSQHDTYLPLLNEDLSAISPGPPSVSQVSDKPSLRTLPSKKQSQQKQEWVCDEPNCGKVLKTKSELK